MRIQQFDADTGELLDATVVLCFNRKKIGDRFCMLIQSEAWDILLQDRDITLTAHRVLMFMINRLDFENYVQIRQAVIAEKLGIAPPNVSLALKLLVEKGIFEIINSSGYRGYRLNSDYAWKGRAKTLDDHRAERREQRREQRARIPKAA